MDSITFELFKEALNALELKAYTDLEVLVNNVDETDRDKIEILYEIYESYNRILNAVEDKIEDLKNNNSNL